MKTFLKEILKDNQGHPSSMRLAFLLLTVTFCPTFVVVWAFVSIYNRGVADVPTGVGALIGILLVGKSIQKGIEVFGEVKKEQQPPPENTP